MLLNKNNSILHLFALFSLFFLLGCSGPTTPKPATPDIPDIKAKTTAAARTNEFPYDLCNEGQKLRIAVFAYSDKNTDTLKDVTLFGIEELLIKALKANNRFDIVERQSLHKTYNVLEPILSEIKLSMTGLVDKDAVLEAGYEKLISTFKALKDHQDRFTYQDGSLRAILKEIRISQTGLADAARMAGYILSADCMLFCAVQKDKEKSILEISLLDVETQDRLIDFKTSISGLDVPGKRFLSRYLGQEIEKQLPNARGKLQETNGNQIKVIFKSGIPLKTGMKLNILQLKEPVPDKTGGILCYGTDLMGQARITSVAGNTAIAILRDDLRITEPEPKIIAIIR